MIGRQIIDELAAKSTVANLTAAKRKRPPTDKMPTAGPTANILILFVIAILHIYALLLH